MAVQKKQQEQKGQGAAYTPAEQRNQIQRYNDTVRDYISGHYGGDDKTYVTMSGGPGYSIALPNMAQGMQGAQGIGKPQDFRSSGQDFRTWSQQQAMNRGTTLNGTRYNFGQAAADMDRGILPQSYVDLANRGYVGNAWQNGRTVQGKQKWDNFVSGYLASNDRPIAEGKLLQGETGARIINDQMLANATPQNRMGAAVASGATGEKVTPAMYGDIWQRRQYAQDNKTNAPTWQNPYMPAEDQYYYTQDYDPRILERVNYQNLGYNRSDAAYALEQRAYAADPTNYAALRAAEQGDPSAYYRALFAAAVHGRPVSYGEPVKIGEMTIRPPENPDPALAAQWLADDGPIARAGAGWQNMRMGMISGDLEDYDNAILDYFGNEFKARGIAAGLQADQMNSGSKYADALWNWLENPDNGLPEDLDLGRVRQVLKDAGYEQQAELVLGMPVDVNEMEDAEVASALAWWINQSGGDRKQKLYDALGVNLEADEELQTLRTLEAGYGSVGSRAASEVNRRERFENEYGWMRDNPDFDALTETDGLEEKLGADPYFGWKMGDNWNQEQKQLWAAMTGNIGGLVSHGLSAESNVPENLAFAQYLTDDERRLLRYVYASPEGGTEKALAMLKDLWSVGNERRVRSETRNLENMTRSSGWAAAGLSGASIPMNVAGAIKAAPATILNLLGLKVDASDPAYDLTRAVLTIRNTTGAMIDDAVLADQGAWGKANRWLRDTFNTTFGRFAYDTLMSVGDNLAADMVGLMVGGAGSKLGGIVVQSLMSSEAANSKFVQLMQQNPGMDMQKAAGIALFDGLVEAGTEAWSFQNLYSPNAITRGEKLRAWFINGLFEGTEELTGNIVDLVGTEWASKLDPENVDGAISGRAKQLQEEAGLRGEILSDADAWARAAEEWTANTCVAFASGALAGWAEGAGASAHNAVATWETGKEYRGMNGEGKRTKTNGGESQTATQTAPSETTDTMSDGRKAELQAGFDGKNAAEREGLLEARTEKPGPAGYAPNTTTAEAEAAPADDALAERRRAAYAAVNQAQDAYDAAKGTPEEAAAQAELQRVLDENRDLVAGKDSVSVQDALGQPKGKTSYDIFIDGELGVNPETNAGLQDQIAEAQREMDEAFAAYGEAKTKEERDAAYKAYDDAYFRLQELQDRSGVKAEGPEGTLAQTAGPEAKAETENAMTQDQGPAVKTETPEGALTQDQGRGEKTAPERTLAQTEKGGTKEAPAGTVAQAQEKDGEKTAPEGTAEQAQEKSNTGREEPAGTMEQPDLSNEPDTYEEAGRKAEGKEDTETKNRNIRTLARITDTLDEHSEAKQYLDKLRKKDAHLNKINNYQLGKLLMLTEAALDTDSRNTMERVVTEGLSRQLRERGIPMTQEIQNAAIKMLTGEKLTRAEKKALRSNPEAGQIVAGWVGRGTEETNKDAQMLYALGMASDPQNIVREEQRKALKTGRYESQFDYAGPNRDQNVQISDEDDERAGKENLADHAHILEAQENTDEGTGRKATGIAKLENGEVALTVTNADGSTGTEALGSFEFVSERQRKAYETAAKIAEQFGQELGNGFLRVYQKASKLDAATVAEGFQAVIDAARFMNEVAPEKKAFVALMPEDVRQEAVAQGEKLLDDDEKAMGLSKAERTAIRSSLNGTAQIEHVLDSEHQSIEDYFEALRGVDAKYRGLVRAYSNEHVTTSKLLQLHYLNMMGRTFGFQVVAVDSLQQGTRGMRGAQGAYNYQAGFNRVFVGMDAMDGNLLEVGLHEIWHAMRQLGGRYAANGKFGQTLAEQVKAVEDQVFKILEDNGETRDELIQRKIADYARGGVTLTEDEAADEIVANAMPALLQDEQFARWLYEFAPDEAKAAEGWVNRFANWLQKLAGGTVTRNREAAAVLEQKNPGELTPAQIYERTQTALNGLFKTWQNAGLFSGLNINDEMEGRFTPGTGTEASETQYDLDYQLLSSELDNWVKAGKPDSWMIRAGTTPDAFLGLNVPDAELEIKASKIKEVMGKHHEITIDTFKQLPRLLNHPMIIFDSLKTKGRLVVFGELYANMKDKNGITNRIPILAVLDTYLTKDDRRNIDIVKIVNAYAKDSNPQGFIQRSSYVERARDEKRAAKWLDRVGLQLPLRQPSSVSMHIIIQRGRDVKYENALRDGNLELAREVLDIVAAEKGYVRQGFVYKDSKGQEKSWDLETFDDNGQRILPSKRFDDSKSDTRWSIVTPQQDNEYRAAVESGDMQTAQRMVNEAARAAGYNPEYLVWRGDSAPYTVLKTPLELDAEDYEGGNLGNGLYFTPERSYAERFAKNGVLRKFYLKANPADLRNGSVQRELQQIVEEFSEEYGEPTNLELFDELLNRLDKNAVIGEGVGGFAYGAEEIAVQESWQAKLADPATYDDDGQLIPLSERFNEGKQDIRWSLAGTAQTIRDLQNERATIEEAIQQAQESEEYKNAFNAFVNNPSSMELLEAYKRAEDSSGLSDLVRRRNEVNERLKNLQEQQDREIEEAGKQAETEAIAKSGLAPEEYHRKKAINEYGYTSNFAEAGYMLPNGRLLNFSGQKGMHTGDRGQDHRNISVVYEDSATGSEHMLRFMGEGNIRVMAETPGVDISTAAEPTAQQYAAIRRFVNEYASRRGYFSVDLTDQNGRTVGTYEYEAGVKADKVISDIKYYFANGNIREQSTLDKFRWSLAPEEQKREREAVAKAMMQDKVYTAELRDLMAAMAKGNIDRLGGPRGSLEYQGRDLLGLARRIKQQYGSGINSRDLSENLASVFTSLANARNEAEVQGAVDALSSLAADVLDRVIEADELYNTQTESLREFLRGRRFRLTETQEAEVRHVYGSLKAFRDMMFPTIFISSSKNTSVPTLDSSWGDLCEEFPEYFDNTASEGEEPAILAYALEASKARQIRSFGQGGSLAMYADQAAEDLTLMMWDEYLETPGWFTPNRQPEDLDQTLEAVRQARQKLNQEGRDDSASPIRQVEQVREEYKTKLMNERRKLQEKYQKEAQARREATERASMRNQARRERDRLEKTLDNPGKLGFVPLDMLDAVRKLVKAADFQGANAVLTRDVVATAREAYEAMGREGTAEDGENPMRAYFSEDTLQYFKQLEKALEKGPKTTRNVRNPNDMLSHEEILALRNILANFNAAIRNSNQLFTSRRNESFDQAGRQFVADISPLAQARNARKPGAVAQTIGGVTKRGMMTPTTAFDRLRKTRIAEAYQALRKGLDQHIRNVTAAQNFAEETIKRFGMQDSINAEKKAHRDDRAVLSGKKKPAADNQKTFTFTDQRGREFRLTDQEIMTIYAWRKREPKIKTNHLLAPTGGIKLQNAGAGTEQIVYKLTPRLLQEMFSKLTDDQKAFVDTMVEYLSTECAQWGNSVTRLMYGYDKFTESYYFPFAVNRNYVANDPGKARDARLKTDSMTKAITEMASNPLDVRGFFDIWCAHVEQMSDYNAFVLPLEDMTRLMNYIEGSRDESGRFIKTGESVRDLMTRAYGENLVKYIDNFMTRMNGNSRMEYGNQLLNKIMGGAKGAAVSANMSVAIQQMGAGIRAAAVLDPRDVAQGIARGFNHPGRIYEELEMYAPIATLKAWGYFDTQMKYGLSDRLTQDRWKSFQEKSGILASWGDMLNWAQIWEACKAEQRRVNGSLSEEERMKRAGERFAEVIDKTQVVDSILHRSEFAAEKGMMRHWMAFMSEPIKQYNMILRNINDYLDARALKDGKGQREALNGLRRSAAGIVISAIITALLKTGVSALRDWDDEKKKKVLDETTGKETMVITGRRTYLNKFADHYLPNLWDNLSGVIPMFSTLVSMAKGDSSDLTAAGLKNAGDTIKQLGKLFSGEDVDLYKLGYSAFGVAANTTGVGFHTAYRDLMSIGRQFLAKANDSTSKGAAWDENRTLAERLAAAQAQYVYSKEAKDLPGNAGKTVNTNIWGELLMAAFDAGGIGEDFVAVADAAIAAGAKEDSLVNLFKRRWTDGAALADQAAAALNAGDLEGYNGKLKEMKDAGVSEKIAASMISTSLRELQPEEEEAPGTGQGTVRKLTEGSASSNPVKTAYTARMKDAMARGDTAALEESISALRTEGIPEKQIVSAAKSGIKELYQAGTLDETRARDLLQQYGGVQSEKDLYWTLDEWQQKDQHEGETDYTYSRWQPVDDLVDSGASLSREAIGAMTAGGYTEKEVYSHARTRVKELYRDGKIPDSQLDGALKRYGGSEYTDAELHWQAREIRDTKGQGGKWSRYDALYAALDGGNSGKFRTEAKELVRYWTGTSAKTDEARTASLMSTVMSHYKDDYLAAIKAGNTGKAASIKAKLKNAASMLGIKWGRKQESTIKGWTKNK